MELGDGSVVTPTSWMSLSGRAQATPDRNTRGWIDANGQRHWLDVFADVTPPINAPEAPLSALLLVAGAAAVLFVVVRRRRRRQGGP